MRMSYSYFIIGIESDSDRDLIGLVEGLIGKNVIRIAASQPLGQPKYKKRFLFF